LCGFRKRADLKKKPTAHILRHTVATTLLFNGCPIGHIKDILGNEYLLTRASITWAQRSARPRKLTADTSIMKNRQPAIQIRA